MDFPGGSDGEESACNAGDLDSIRGLGRYLGGGHGNPLQYSGLENPHEQRSLMGYSPWGRKESDMTERISTAHKANNGASLVKNPPVMQKTWTQSLCWEDPLEKGKATHSSILAWRFPWTI